MENTRAGRRNKLRLLGLLLVAAAAMVVSGRGGAAAADTLQCGDAVNALVPCGPFLLGVTGEKNPSAECCHSAKVLNVIGSTVELRRQLCRCLKQAGPSFGVVPDRAQRLPALCKLNFHVPISSTMDCNRVQ